MKIFGLCFFLFIFFLAPISHGQDCLRPRTHRRPLKIRRPPRTALFSI